MTSKDQFDIDNLANLSKIALSDDEKEEFKNELSSILDFVSKVQELDLDLEPKLGAVYNSLRDDKAPPEALSDPKELIEASKVNNGKYILVKKVIKQ